MFKFVNLDNLGRVKIESKKFPNKYGSKFISNNQFCKLRSLGYIGKWIEFNNYTGFRTEQLQSKKSLFFKLLDNRIRCKIVMREFGSLSDSQIQAVAERVKVSSKYFASTLGVQTLLFDKYEIDKTTKTRMPHYHDSTNIRIFDKGISLEEILERKRYEAMYS